MVKVDQWKGCNQEEGTGGGSESPQGGFQYRIGESTIDTLVIELEFRTQSYVRKSLEP